MRTREIYAEMEQMLGLVPGFMKLIPEDSIEMEWGLFKKTIFGESLIPNKYKELMGIAVAASSHCKYCAAFHSVSARLFGATEQEIEEAVRYSKHSTGWSTYLNGMQIDFENFKRELDEVAAYITKQNS